jgi:hypothetical protein
MARLLFEIWENEEEATIMLHTVSPQSDHLLRHADPNTVLRHSFYAESDFGASRLYNEWNGWGLWKPEPDWTERFFTDAEEHEQQLYLASRTRR